MATGTIKRNADTSDILSITETYQGKGVIFNFASGHTFQMVVNKLDASHNYVQFWQDGVDKGYITFTVSRNV